MKRQLLALTLMALTGCSFIPELKKTETPVAASWPTGKAYPEAYPEHGKASDLGWNEFLLDQQLRNLISIALENNRDLRTAMLNVEAYRALYQIQRAEQWPTISATASASRQRVPADVSLTGNEYILAQKSLSVGITAYELDFFGRVRSLKAQALEQYLSTEEAYKSVYISLVSELSASYFTWLADNELLQIAQRSLTAYEDSYKLVTLNFEGGISSALTLHQAQGVVESARSDVQRYTRQVAQDLNAIQLLVASKIPLQLEAMSMLKDPQLADFAVSLHSDVLLERPDVLSAEHQLQAANANIGAARAAFFPSISLTSSIGTASSELNGLFNRGSQAWTFAPQISIPIFTSGRLKASLDYAEIQRDISAAHYEKTIQTAFREVSDGLAARGTYHSQLAAQAAYVLSNQQYVTLAINRYKAGVDDYLTVLDAQRTLYKAEQQWTLDRLSQLTSDISLYKALGGGWKGETSRSKTVP